MELSGDKICSRLYRAEFKFSLRRGVCKYEISRCSRCFGKDTAASKPLAVHLHDVNCEPHIKI
ncbi:hypothetical protein [uncultured Campylobacter sp.]|uniref:hypothetical protein n=1 Tax=uncultured Campylobacter sp. TaxID=218934 RepID=UPI00261E8772|nr:hypothetical protein [uncultured Campylobacter sp.]